MFELGPTGLMDPEVHRVQSARYRPGPRHDAELGVAVFQRRLPPIVGSVLAPGGAAELAEAAR